MKALCTTIAILCFMVPVSVFGETRVYQSEKPVHEVIPSFIDELGAASIQFRLLRNYNEVRDGKLGFVMYLLPGERYADISFHADEKSRGSLVRVTTQDRRDGEIFYNILFDKMKMSEPGVQNPVESSPGWPTVPGR